MAPLFGVRNLVTRFYAEQGVVNAVNGISYTLGEGESLGIVGESGCGKTVSVISLVGLIPSPPGRVRGIAMALSTNPAQRSACWRWETVLEEESRFGVVA